MRSIEMMGIYLLSRSFTRLRGSVLDMTISGSSNLGEESPRIGPGCHSGSTYQIHLVELHLGISSSLVEGKLHASGPGHLDLVTSGLESVENLAV